jgi:catechol 2,3-dioxygenase-like lactoylglutathione lyase family enzyme
MHHFGMMVKDLDISIRNYETLGFKVYKRFTKPGMKAAMLFNGNAGIEFFEFENPEDGDALKIKKHSAFESDDLEYDVDQYLKLGYKLAIPISKGSVVKRFAYLQDNADNYIELLEP